MNHRRFRVAYVLPSRYDDDGYVYRYRWGVLPSNTLTCLASLTRNLDATNALGEDVDICVEIYDDTVQRIPVDKIVREARRDGAQLLVGIVGVQTNQFPRAGDLALQFREHDVPVMIGGFHVSGIMALFGEASREMQDLMDRGVTLVSGEVDGPGVFEGILRDALEGSLKPMYRVTETPDIFETPIPLPDPKYLKRFAGRMGTVDTSRGCPFNCSFCTIINVQGRKMRHRSAACILKVVEDSYDMGVLRFFFTDDNFSRSPIWKELFDGLTKLRARGKNVQFMMQVDTQAWRIKGFIEGAEAAGCFLTFIGMETINEANLAAMDKPQNKVDQYAKMVARWHEAGIMVHVGYIIGLPHDSVESVRSDIAVLCDEIKVDEASFFMLTPLPGSRDHLDMVNAGVPLDADLNNFDSFHETFRHAILKPGEWRALYDEAWESFYNKENITNILLRCGPEQYWQMFWLSLYNRHATMFRTHPMITGFLRQKCRKERRPIFPRESIFQFGWRRAKDRAFFFVVFWRLFFEYQEIWLLTHKKGESHDRVLTDLRDRWAETRQRLRMSRFSSRWEDAGAEIRGMFRHVSERIDELVRTEGKLSNRLRRRLIRKAEEASESLREFESETPTEKNVQEAERYISERLVRGYEEIVVGFLSMRRRCNFYRRDLLERLKTGRLIGWSTLIATPRMMYYEMILGLRFVYAFFRGVLSRLRATPESEVRRALP